MPWTATSDAAPPPSYQVPPSPPSPSRYDRVPWVTELTARSGWAMPRSTGSGNIRSAYSCSPAMDPPPRARPANALFDGLNYSSRLRDEVLRGLLPMHADDLILVSVDDHLVEPPTLFDGHIPARYRDQAPKIVRNDDGSDVWVFKEFPDIRIALSEGGTGWIPYFLDRLDRTYDMHHLWTGQDFGGRMPSDVFREHFLTCFIADPVGLRLRHDIGIDNIAWECDYPHSDSSWPTAAEELADVAGKAGVPDDELYKIGHENAMRWYSYDPFAHRPRAECTVGALRAEAAGHDVSVRSLDKGRFERSGKGVDLGKLAAKATA